MYCLDQNSQFITPTKYTLIFSVLYIKLLHVSVLVHHPQGAQAAKYKTNRH
jgi:hypothetical protein